MRNTIELKEKKGKRNSKFMVEDKVVYELIPHCSGLFIGLYMEQTETRYYQNVMNGVRGYGREEWVRVDEYLVDEESLEEGLYKVSGGEKIEANALFNKNGNLICKGIDNLHAYNARKDEFTLTLFRDLCESSLDSSRKKTFNDDSKYNRFIHANAPKLWCLMNSSGEYVIPPTEEKLDFDLGLGYNIIL